MIQEQQVTNILIFSESKQRIDLIKKIINEILSSCKFSVIGEYSRALDSLKLNGNEFDLIVLENEQESMRNRDILETFVDSKIIILYENSKCEKYFEKINNIYPIPVKRLLFDFIETLKEAFGQKNPIRFDSKIDLTDNVIYFSLPKEVFQRITFLPCDIYVSLGNNKKYVKVGNANESVESGSIDLYINKGVDKFYLLNSDYYKFEDVFYPKELREELLTPEKNKTERALEIVRGAVTELGFSEVIIDQVDTIIDDIYKKFKGEEFKDLLSSLDSSKGSYLYNHSYLCSLLSCSFMKTQSWNSVDMQRKVITACMLHDLGFEDRKNAFYETISIENKKNLPKAVQKDLEQHTERIVTVLKRDQNISDDILRIVNTIHYDREMAEMASSTTFNKLAVIVNMSHELTVRLFKVAFNPMKIDIVLEKFKMDYNRAPYESIMKTYIDNISTVLKTAG